MNDKALRDAASDGREWLTYGRDYSKTRFSPLKQIDSTNVQRLGLARIWPTQALGAMESTPLVSNGILYGTLSYGAVFAFDLHTGEWVWEWDAKVALRDSTTGLLWGCELGAALYQGRVDVGALDGRLVALDAKTGKVDWEVQTTPKASGTR